MEASTDKSQLYQELELIMKLPEKLTSMYSDEKLSFDEDETAESLEAESDEISTGQSSILRKRMNSNQPPTESFEHNPDKTEKRRKRKSGQPIPHSPI